MNTKVVVTGGAGFIGSHIVDALVEKGYEVHVIDDLSAGEKKNINKKAEFHRVSITDLKKISKIIAGSTYVFHLAALPQVQQSIEFPVGTHEINVTGTLNVLSAAKDAKVKKVVFSASCAAYGDQINLPIKEDAAVAPKSPYALHKYIGEQYARLFSELYSLPTVCLRYFNVYGPRQSVNGAYPSAIAKFVQLRKEGKPLTIVGSGGQTRDFVHVTDVVSANILAAESERVMKGEAINIGSGKRSSVNEIATLVGGPVISLPARVEPKDSQADISKAQELLGWSPKVTLEEGVKGLMA